MSQDFAQVVERVKQLSLEEKQELLELLDGLLEGTGKKPRFMCRNITGRSGKKFDLAELASRMPVDYQATEEGFGEPVGCQQIQPPLQDERNDS